MSYLNEFEHRIDNLADIINNGGTQTEFDHTVKHLSGFDIRFVYGMIQVTEQEQLMEQNIRRTITKFFIKNMKYGQAHDINPTVENLNHEQRQQLDSELSKISFIHKRKKRIRRLLKNSSFIEKENNQNAYLNKVYNVVPEIQYEHNFLKEAGIPLIAFDWGKQGEHLTDKPWYQFEVYPKKTKLDILLEREEAARERFQELVDLYGKGAAIAIISRGKPKREKPSKTKDCTTCDFIGTKVCRWCPTFRGE